MSLNSGKSQSSIWKKKKPHLCCLALILSTITEDFLYHILLPVKFM